MKKDLQEKLHSPIAFKHVVQKLPPGRPDKINLDYEVDMVMQNLFIHKLVEADPEMRKQLKNEFDQELRYFTQLPLDEAVALFKESVDDQLLSSAGTVVIQRQEKDFEEGGDEVMEVDAST
ncbi:hypothetical protein C0J52_24818 [Blattella germanica]|nr:hypothetical protein C0J52_24818 [Blattella germanica]